MKEIASYQNGNTYVTILEDGTKIREWDDIPSIVHPESIDVKITNYCDMGCLYCHESSTTAGKHGDLIKLAEVLGGLPSGVELAIGGGNPLSHPNLLWFLKQMKERGIICNITVNQGHLKTYQSLLQKLILEELIMGVGISVTNNNFKYVTPLLQLTDNIVYHLIAGVNSIEVIDKLMELGECKVLILGYKVFGFGVDYFSSDVERSLNNWNKNLRNYLQKCTISFDNLAIEQLNVKKYFTHEGWETFYMGDDFQYTMYIDAVTEVYAPTSRSSSNRVSFNDKTLIKYFSQGK